MSILVLDSIPREMNIHLTEFGKDELYSELLNARDLDRLWYSVQAFLAAAGNVSKLLWGSNRSSAERRIELRASLSVSDDSPLRPRIFRNHFEHFDERLEQWATSSKRHNFADSNVGPPNMIVGIDPEDFLRNFDTENFAVTFRGDVYHFRPVLATFGKRQ